LEEGEGMIDFGQRDPEEVGPEHPDDLDLRMRVVESRHVYEGNGGKCEADYRDYRDGKVCGMDKWSVMHIDDHLDRHDHGGGDCMCFEGDY
jgi:hypothetical protein